MGFNNALETQQFIAEHRAMYKEYKAAGMSDEDIAQVFELDKQQFLSERRFEEHNISLDYGWDSKVEREAFCNYLRTEYPDVFIYEEDTCQSEHIDWQDYRDMEKLNEVISSLTKKQRRILELYTVKGMSFVDIAKKEGITKQTVFTQMERIKKKFKKVFVQ